MTKRTTALLLVVGLLNPILLLKPTRTVSASSNLSVIRTPATPISAPPEPFILSSTNSISSAALSSFTTLGASVSGGHASILNFLTAPQNPAGLPGVQTVSPFSAFASSFSSSATSAFSSFFGLITPSSKTAASAAPAVSTALVLQPAGSVSFDFDGDGKADIGSWKRASGEWKVRNSLTSAVTTQTLGTNASVVAPADYDGDGKTDFAVFAASTATWTIKRSSDGAAQIIAGFGQAGDKPVPGNYDNDTIADAAFYRPSNGTWYVRQSSNTQVVTYQFGLSTDIPVPGNYDGDSKTDFAVYRPSDGSWYVMGSTSGFMSQQWGVASDIPVPADYDGDGKTDYAVYRGSSGVWFVIKSSSATFSYTTQSWGNYGDQPVPADYDGDGRADFAVWRPTNTVWYVSRSAAPGYDGWALGATGDTAVPSAYVKQVGGEVYSYDFAKTRLSPKNATGGTNLYSRNFSWGTGLVGLSGRAGLDAGFGISYNSLVWTKEGSAIIFDADKDNVAPGFRLGYPTIEPVYYDSATQKFNYLMITPSGAKVEFRQQQGASNIYETADSSYTQLKVNGSGNPNDAAETLPITITGTDGAQMSYSYIAGAYRCTQIKDANGNFITIYNDENGLLRTVTDTLGRVITVNYDGDFNPTTVTQTWKDNNGAGNNVTHIYATFNYAMTPMNPNFGSNINTIYGPQDVSVQVLESITFADGASTKFGYNSYGQVYKVSSYAADNHLLNYTKTDLETPAVSQTDCPRFSQTRNWVKNFNKDTNNNEQEVVINNSITENASYTIGGLGGTATRIEVSTTGEPNNHVSRTYVGAFGWTEGLPIATEDLATENGSYGQRRWTTTAWIQDNTSLSYIQNPRVVESKVGDASNVKKTTVDYITQSGITLPYQTKIYDSNQTTALKTSLTEYNWTSAYLSRRIIGLAAKSELYNENNALVSKVTYAYDEGNFTDALLNQNLSSAIQHDNTNYGAGFIAGRGNLTSTTRWDVTGQTAPVSSSVKYNTTGAAVAQITPGSAINTTREVKISYADSFNDNTNRNTFAYPTKMTDPAGNFSEVKYRFDTGANVWAKSPAPQNQTQGKVTERIFDSIGRLQKQLLVNNGAYSRYEYPASGVQSKVFATITSGAGEAFTESWTDGAGRVRQSRTELPNSTGGWSGTLTEYDITGQVKRSTVPTEIDESWNPAGDNLTGGWLWTSQEYDWKGRTTRTVNTDGTDTLSTYDGCGCAGGAITTIRGEEIEPNKRQTRKIYTDILGREQKTETLDWNGIVYQTTVNTYNARDQITLVKQYAGAEYSSTFQDTIYNYDGHGRLKERHLPEQDANKFTTYTYFPDDRYETATDARGAATHYIYNNRGLIQQLSYTVPQNPDPEINIEVPSIVTFNYDAAGNRTHMTDGMGTVDYEYSQLSQMTAETRQFNETVMPSPTSDNKFKLQYAYDLSGKLTSLAEPFGEIVSYSYDKTGRLETVAGNQTNQSQQNYVTNADYRAWGAVKKLDYGDNSSTTINYNNRLQAQEYNYSVIGSPAYSLQIGYSYYNDGRLKATTGGSSYNTNRSFEYDFVGRMTAAKTGLEALGQVETNPLNRPYRHEYQYDAFGHMTQSVKKHWQASFTLNQQYQNNRTFGQTSDVSDIPCGLGCNYGDAKGFTNTFDADGRSLNYSGDLSTYNAAGNLVTKNVEKGSGTNYRIADFNYKFDGNGKPIQEIYNDSTFNNDINSQSIPCAFEDEQSTQGYYSMACQRKTYFVYSTVLQENIVELGEVKVSPTVTPVRIIEQRRVLKIIANKEEIAERKVYHWIYGQQNNSSGYSLEFKSKDASGFTQKKANRQYELDAFGAVVGSISPYQSHPQPENDDDCYHDSSRDDDWGDWVCRDDYPEDEDAGHGNVPENICYKDDFEANCNELEDYLTKNDDTPVKKDVDFLAPSTEGPQTIGDSDSNVKAQTLSQSQSFGLDKSGMPTTDLVQTNQYSVDLGTAASFGLGSWDLRNETLDKGSPIDEGGNGAIVLKDCVSALNGANQNIDAVKRAVANMEALEKAAEGHEVFTAPLLAAIAVRESGFQIIPEVGGGRGKGVFQITSGNPSQQVLDSVELSAKWVLDNKLVPGFNDYRYTNSNALGLLGSLRNYNAGGGSEVGFKFTSKTVKEQSKAGAPYSPQVFSYGTAYPGMDKNRKYELGNYVKNVFDIAINCFDYVPPAGIPNP